MKKTPSSLRRNKRPIVVIILVTLLLLASAIYVYFGTDWLDSRPESGIDYRAPTDEQIDAGKQTAEQKKPDTDTSNNSQSDSTADPDQPGRTNPQRGSIHLTVSSQDGTTYTIRTLIRDITSGGSCELTLKRGDNIVYSDKADTQMVASNSTCRGFDIDTSSLSAGPYTMTITYTHGSASTSVSEDIIIK